MVCLYVCETAIYLLIVASILKYMIEKESFRAIGENPFTHQPYDNPFTPNKLEEYNVHNAL